MIVFVEYTCTQRIGGQAKKKKNTHNGLTYKSNEGYLQRFVWGREDKTVDDDDYDDDADDGGRWFRRWVSLDKYSGVLHR